MGLSLPMFFFILNKTPNVNNSKFLAIPEAVQPQIIHPILQLVQAQ